MSSPRPRRVTARRAGTLARDPEHAPAWEGPQPGPEVTLVEPFAPPEPLVIGLLGGIAAGKSTVAGMLGSHGLCVIDADQMARQAAADPEIASQLAKRFGPEVAPAGGVDRKELARLAFTDERARRDLEGILHPAIRRAIAADLEDARKHGKSVVLDVPLLLEGGLIDSCDTCIFVEASEPSRQKRARVRGWDTGELDRRESVQAALPVKKARCAYTITTDGPLEDIAPRVAALLRQIAADHTTRD